MAIVRSMCRRRATRRQPTQPMDDMRVVGSTQVARGVVNKTTSIQIVRDGVQAIVPIGMLNITMSARIPTQSKRLMIAVIPPHSCAISLSPFSYEIVVFAW